MKEKIESLHKIDGGKKNILERYIVYNRNDELF